MMKELGELRIVSIREVWPLEPQHFSTWLAGNIPKLGDAIGIDLELRRREVGVGAFSLDILAHDIVRDRVVIIENQLSKTDHDHLGKLITYAAGLKAFVVIWISPEFRDEHRAALDWLNENTDETKEFFGIQIEALRIDDSRPAPNFKLLAFPNGWQKSTSASAQQSGEDSARRALFLQYFGELSSVARQSGFPKAQAATGQPHLVLDRLSAGEYIAVAFSRDLFTAGVYIAHNNAVANRRIYEQLFAEAADIENEVGSSLKWDFNEARLRQQVWASIPVNRFDQQSLEISRDWALQTARKLKLAFEPRLIRAAQSTASPALDGDDHV